MSAPSAAAPPKAASTIAERVAFLADPRSYPGGANAVQVAETHLSWVFLTGGDAYKLKKPLRFDHLDLREPAARAAHCRLEIRLNRRLAEDVYLGAVPLVRDVAGRLRLGGQGEAEDWLVHMRRLPAALMMDGMIARGALGPGDVASVASTLAGFYRICAPDPITAVEWRARFMTRVLENVGELAMRLGPDAVERLGERQVEFVDRHADLFDARVEDGRVVEGHGDLRPEHVCLETPPRIIDCLEFSRELRVVDSAEELGFLALECERLGAAEVKPDLFGAYASVSGDRPPPALVDFYQSHHACVRAKLALRHLADDHVAGAPHWVERARLYVALAQAHLVAALGS